MSEQLKFNEVFKQVKSINKILFESGKNLKQVDEFWKSCIKEARKDYVMGRFFNGETDGEISRDSGYCSSVISKITTEHWNAEMYKKQLLEDAENQIC